MIPFIPFLAVAGIVGGLIALGWYYNQTEEKREEADRIALKWFKNRFIELSEAQQRQVWREINKI